MHSWSQRPRSSSADWSAERAVCLGRLRMWDVLANLFSVFCPLPSNIQQNGGKRHETMKRLWAKKWRSSQKKQAPSIPLCFIRTCRLRARSLSEGGGAWIGYEPLWCPSTSPATSLRSRKAESLWLPDTESGCCCVIPASFWFSTRILVRYRSINPSIGESITQYGNALKKYRSTDREVKHVAPWWTVWVDRLFRLLLSLDFFSGCFAW